MPSESIKARLREITKIPKERLVCAPPAPKSVKIELTPRCNYLCQYCAICFRNGHKLKDMDFDFFKRITREMREAGVEEIGVFYIGESFMNPMLLVSAIEYLKNDLKTPYVFLTSNASLAYPKYVALCMEVGLDSLKWSVNAADVQQFKDLMKVSPALFKQAKDNIRMAHYIRNLRGYTTRLYASSIFYNQEQLHRSEQFLRDNILPYVDEHYWLPLYTAGGQAKEKERKLGMQPIAGNTGRLDDPCDPIPCWTLFTAAHIRSNGKMTACCLDGIGTWDVGDLNTQTFMESWNSENFVNLRKAHLALEIKGTKCEKCALMG